MHVDRGGWEVRVSARSTLPGLWGQALSLPGVFSQLTQVEAASDHTLKT